MCMYTACAYMGMCSPDETEQGGCRGVGVGVMDINMGMHMDVHMGMHMDMHMGMHMGMHMDVHMGVHMGMHIDMHMGVHMGVGGWGWG